MLTAIKIIWFLFVIGLIAWTIYANATYTTHEPCDPRECKTCPFTCEGHKYNG